VIHGGHDVALPIEALLWHPEDPELALARGPLAPDEGSCKFEACESDEFCTCQEDLEE